MRKPTKTSFICTVLFISCVFVSVLLNGCAVFKRKTSKQVANPEKTLVAENISAEACPLTEPVWFKPPEDTAVSDAPVFGYYYVKEDRSILASAWWTETEAYHLRASEEGLKVGWFRPAGADLQITGRRLDGQAPPLRGRGPLLLPHPIPGNRVDLSDRRLLGSKRESSREHAHVCRNR